MSYAENTSVSVDKSQMEIKKTLAKYGCKHHPKESEAKA